ncbi:hydroxymethylbilane synthase [Lentilactobacillus kosonis]|uniref:Porphobilinogen deaminase n=1 Tax=Lentilactobacillus kosonis TaxID=2810561 RepID=A0A401FMM7_9LACO|nr:hydroxymethylbilane synthase [Lentilactobacillus kosonis]GAY73639.1 porphobilinogen deaminase [Lentilactobacillus kosonis]
MKSKFVVGSRKSNLALVQTRMVVKQLSQLNPDIEFEIKEITTEGDVRLKESLQKIGGKGVFIKEIENELAEGQIDFAVHSLKDVTPELDSRVTIGAILKRASPFDLLISKQKFASLADLPRAARIGTNSVRRQGQILHLRDDVSIIPIRGNVETRINKIESENLDGVILAEAGISRLGIDISKYNVLNLKNELLPAAGQGAIAVECRAADKDTLNLLNQINDEVTRRCVDIERSFLDGLGGSCNFPIGSFAEPKDDQIKFTGLVASSDGKHFVTDSALTKDDANVGRDMAIKMQANGIMDLLY